ncbi:porin family protein [Cryomorphaceae bacterium 1068]|nr:porin family protein [Cryomorphaceae bacterium 1068]
MTKLKDAGLLIEEGRNDEAINLLKDALENCNFSSEDKITAHKALILAYFEIDDLESADASAEAIIKINPNYKADKLRDPAEMIALFEKYKPVVTFRAGLTGGINSTSVEASATYSIVTDDDTPGLANYESEVGFQIGATAEYRLWMELWVGSGLSFRRSSYSNSVPNVEGRTISYSEDLNYFDIPLSLNYYFLDSKLQPFVTAGGQVSFLASAVGELSRDDISDLVDRDIQREDVMVGFFGGAGLAYQYGNLSFRLSANYMFYPEEVNKEGTRYENLESIFRYYYLDNDFTIDFLQVKAGVVYHLGFKTAK